MKSEDRHREVVAQWDSVRRRRRVDAATDDANVSSVAPPFERIVDDGLLIALSAVRMAVKNDIIVGALRDHADYDLERYAATARNELRMLARQNEEYARRVSGLREDLTKSGRKAALSSDEWRDVHQLALRRRVHERLAIDLDAVANDGDHVARIVEHARRAASDEISDAVSTRLIRLAIDWRDPEYEQRRAARTEMFVHVDLALLASAHATANGKLNEY